MFSFLSKIFYHHYIRYIYVQSCDHKLHSVAYHQEIAFFFSEKKIHFIFVILY